MDGFVKQKDFSTTEVSGTTHATANTRRPFRHGRNQVPWMVVITEGNAYVAKDGLGPNEIDVRSTESSQEFRAILFFN